MEWQDCQGTEEKPLLFKYGKIYLALWWGESFWQIGNPNGGRLTPRQAELVEHLRTQFEEIDEDGALFIPGKESIPDVDYDETDWWTYYRLHDEVDRIQLIQPVIKALIELQHNYSGK